MIQILLNRHLIFITWLKAFLLARIWIIGEISGGTNKFFIFSNNDKDDASKENNAIDNKNGSNGNNENSQQNGNSGNGGENGSNGNNGSGEQNGNGGNNGNSEQNGNGGNNGSSENGENNGNNGSNGQNGDNGKIGETGVGGGDETTNSSESEDDVTYIKKRVSFVKPLDNGTITSRYGLRQATAIVSGNHKGVDIGAKYGTDIKAAMDGQVTVVSDEGDYGKHVKIVDGDVSTIYAHCSKIVVSQGDFVKKGQKIAEVGSTGKSTGPHLHFEIRRNNLSINPEEILSLWGVMECTLK